MLPRGVLSYVLRRLGLGAIVIVAVSFVTWLVFATALNPLWSFFQTPHAPEVEAIRVRAHLHDGVVVRYWLWLKGIFTGQGLGRTVVADQPVWPQVQHAFVVTLELIVMSTIIVVSLSLLVGIVAARRRGSAVDVGLRSFSYVSWAVPAFLLALLLQHAFVAMANDWHFQPFAIGGPPTPGLGFTTRGVEDWFQHMTLPAIAIALGFVGVYSRYLRTSLLVTLDQPYTTVARAKGLPERLVVRRHALRNALVPFTTAIALEFGTIFAATLAADYVFGLHGLASLFLSNGLLNADPYLIEAPILLAAVIVVVASIIGDIVCAALDPRLRYT
jgi:peptide/nickel transport system permease protein